MDAACLRHSVWSSTDLLVALAATCRPVHTFQQLYLLHSSPLFAAINKTWCASAYDRYIMINIPRIPSSPCSHRNNILLTELCGTHPLTSLVTKDGVGLSTPLAFSPVIRTTTTNNNYGVDIVDIRRASCWTVEEASGRNRGPRAAGEGVKVAMCTTWTFDCYQERRG